MSVKEQKPIVIFRGDNTAAFDLRTIKILLTGDLDLTNATARFDLLGFTKSWTTEEVATGELSIVFDSAQTKAFALGPQTGTLRLFDMSTGTPRQLTVVNKIPFFVTNNVCEIDSQSYGINVSVTSGETIHIEFNVGLDAVEGKADKVEGATAGDLASLTEDGNLEDSGIPKADVQRKLTFDSTPTEGSLNPVTSDGIKRAIDAATPADYDTVKEQVETNKSDISDIKAVIPSDASTSNKLATAEDVAQATPSDYATVKAQVEANTGAISTINSKIPLQASAQNQLADKAFVNSSIASNTATFRGTFNQVSDAADPRYGLGLTVDALWWQVSIALANAMETLDITPENNDYCFVQVPKTNADPTIIERVDRYKYSSTVEIPTTGIWQYEWSLNNSSFTAAQWAAINSGITSGLVDKLADLPTAEEIEAKGYVLFDPSNNGSDKNHFNASSHAFLVRTASTLWDYNPSESASATGFKVDIAEYSKLAIKNGSYLVKSDPLSTYVDACHKVVLSSAKISMKVSTTTLVSDIRLVVKSADGSSTLCESDWINDITTGSYTKFEFTFTDNNTWLDDGTQYLFFIEGRDTWGDPKNAYVTFAENQLYTFAQNKGVKWTLVPQTGSETEISDYAIDMEFGITADVTVTLPLANLIDVGLLGFSPLKKYVQGDRCVYNNLLYECLSGGHGPAAWNASHFKLLFRIDSNITIGAGSTTYGDGITPNNNIVIGFNTANAAGTNNIVMGYSAKARCETTTSPAGDVTEGNIVIGFNARADNTNDLRFSPTDSVVIGKYAKMHGSYGIVLGVAAEVTDDKGVAIGTEALAKGGAATAIGYQASTDPDFVNTKAYEVDDIVVQGSYAYKCILAVSAATSLNPNPSPPQDGTHWQLLDGVTISTARSLAVGNDARTTGEGAVAIGSGARARENNSIAIGNGAKSNGQGTATLAINALNKFFLGSDNIVDLINAAVNAAIQNQTIAAAVSTTTATGGGRRLLAAATPTSTTKTEVTPADIGALGNSGAQTLNGDLVLGEGGYLLSADVGGCIITPTRQYIAFPTSGGQLALVSQVYDAIQQIAPNFTAKAYVLNELCVYNGRLYRCTTAITTAEEWTAAHWTEATVEDVLAIIRSALDLKAPLASPAFTGTPTAPTPTAGDNSTKVATTAFVQTAVGSIQTFQHDAGGYYIEVEA